MDHIDIVLNSSSRLATNPSGVPVSSSNFTIQLPTNIILTRQRRLKLLYVQMYNTIYNIDNTNNWLDFQVGVTQYSIQVPPGMYSASSLATSIQTLMTAQINNTWSVTYSTITEKITFTGASAFQLLFSSGSHSSTSLYLVLGFCSSSGLLGINTTSGTSATSTQVVNLTKPLNIYITLNINSGQITTSDSDNPTYIIANNVEPGALIQWTDRQYYEQSFTIPPSFNFLGQITVQLSTNRSQLINLNNSEWSMIVSLCD